MLERLLIWVFKHRNVRKIQRPGDGPYLSRASLLPGDDPHWPRRFGVFLHNLQGPDPSGVHDHPGDNLSIVLVGGYWESFADGTKKWRGAGSIIFRRAEQFHRLDPGPKGAWTLFFTGPKRRKWGFLPDVNGWRYWRDAETSREPIHEWFGLTYSSYLVLPRSILQSAPVSTQRRLVAVLDELRGHFGDLDWPDRYTVHARNENNKFVEDPFRDYERGRRRIPGRSAA